MAQLIESLLILARVTQGDLRCEPVDLSRLARDAIARLRTMQPERIVECVVADGLVGHGDSRLIGILLENLLGNAWKFTAKQPNPRIEFGCTENDGQMVYFVRDN